VKPEAIVKALGVVANVKAEKVKGRPVAPKVVSG